MSPCLPRDQGSSINTWNSSMSSSASCHSTLWLLAPPMHPRTSFLHVHCVQQPNALGNGIRSCGLCQVAVAISWDWVRTCVKSMRVLSSLFLFVFSFLFPLILSSRMHRFHLFVIPWPFQPYESPPIIAWSTTPRMVPRGTRLDSLLHAYPSLA